MGVAITHLSVCAVNLIMVSIWSTCAYVWHVRVCVCVLTVSWSWNMAQPCFRRGMQWIWPTPIILHISSLLLCSGACSESAAHKRTLYFRPSPTNPYSYTASHMHAYSQGRRLCAQWINRVPIIKCPPMPVSLTRTLSPLCVWEGVVVSWLDNANTLFISLCSFSPLYGIA